MHHMLRQSGRLCGDLRGDLRAEAMGCRIAPGVEVLPLSKADRPSSSSRPTVGDDPLLTFPAGTPYRITHSDKPFAAKALSAKN